MIPDMTFSVMGKLYGFRRNVFGKFILMRHDEVAARHPDLSSTSWFDASLHDTIVFGRLATELEKQNDSL